MRFVIPCYRCFDEDLSRLTDNNTPATWDDYSQYPVIELNNWPFYEYHCPRGHKHRVIIESELYELLFQQAVYCLQDGYYRESIGTFNSALERYFEYALEMLCLKENPKLDFGAFWKPISKQSERQLGAFYAAYQIVLKEKPEPLDIEKVHLRNEVIHNGKLAAKESAKDFGQYVLTYIRNTQKKIFNHLGDERHIAEASRKTRICKNDLVAAYRDPVEIEVNGQRLQEGVSGIPLDCPLRNASTFKDIDDCISYEADTIHSSSMRFGHLIR